jgi:NADH-quinone oxidoreductase subunit C
VSETKDKQPPPIPDPVTERALAALREALPDAVLDAETTGRHPAIRVRAEHLRDACVLLRDHPDLLLDCCHLISGVDWPDEEAMDVVYHLVSYARVPDEAYRRRPVKNDAWVALKVRVPRERPEVPTVMDIWTGADWHERETWDLMGIRFTGRRELPRILLPEDWPGHPLRKGWVYPASYHGVPIVPPEGL